MLSFPTSRTMNKIITTIAILILYTFHLNHSLSEHGRYPLIKKKKINVKRRRLSLLMDSFVDPIISDDYFYAVLYVGSPISQRVEMALDTGSGLPYFACLSTCTHCGKHDDLPFVLENSTSFEWISCKHKLCGGGKCKNLQNNNICEWSQRYVDKSSISAAVGSDLISFYKYPYLPLDSYKINRDAQHMAINGLVPPLKNEKKLRLIFGCSEHEANTIFRQGADGVMGLSMHHRSFVDQLFDSNIDNNIDLGHTQFAHCFGEETGGILLFGSVEINDLMNKFSIQPIWTPFITTNTGHGWYRVKTVGFAVKYNGNVTNAENEDIVSVHYASNLNAGYHGSVIDTGSSTLSMPRAPSQDIMAAILKLVRSRTDDTFEWAKDMTKNYDFFLQWNGKKIFDDNDWKLLSEKYMNIFPDIVMLWDAEGVPLEFAIPFERYLLFKKPHICLDLFGDTPSILVGSNVMVNKFMIYDRESMRLGVAHIDCDTLLQNDVETSKSVTKEPSIATVDVVDVVGVVGDVKTLLPTNSPTVVDKQEVVIIHLTNYYDIYLKYFLLLIVVSICMYCMCRKSQSGKNSRSNIRYQAVSNVDPDFVDVDQHRKIHNYQRKRNVNDNSSSNNNMSNLNIDNMLSMTTPTQHFTSKHHTNIPVALQHNTDEI